MDFQDLVGDANERPTQGLDILDCLVISTLFSSEVLRNWSDRFAHLIFSVTHSKTHTQLVKTYEVIVIIFKCVVMLMTSINADLNGGKYFSHLICMVVTSIAPFVWIIARQVTIPGSTMLLLGGGAFLFIGLPVKSSVIISQVPRPPWVKSRVLTGLLVFIMSANLILVFYTFQKDISTFEGNSLFSWKIPLAITLSSFGVLLPVTIYMKKYATVETIKEKTLKKIYQGIREDMKSKAGNEVVFRVMTKSQVKFFLFMFILIPAPSIFISRSLITYIYADSDGNPYLDEESNQHSLFANVGSIAVVESSLFLTSKISLRTTKCLSLWLPHVMNAIVMIVVVNRLSCMERLNILPGDIQAANYLDSPIPIPCSNTEILEFYNTVGYCNTLEVKSPYFKVESIPYSERDYVVMKEEDQTFEITFTICKKNLTQPFFKLEVSVIAERIYSYLITGNDTFGVENVIEVTSHSHVKPQRSPILVIMNTFIEKGDETNHEIKIDHLNTPQHEQFTASPANESFSLKSSPGIVRISYRHLAKTADHDDAFRTLDIETYSVYSILIRKDKSTHIGPRSRQKVLIDDYLIMKTSQAQNLLQVLQNEEPSYDHVIKIAFMGAGVSKTMWCVGYYHFIWLESPTRMRTTVIAVFVMYIHMTEFVVDRFLLTKIAKKQATTWVMVQLIMTFCAIVCVFMYYVYLRHEGDEADDKENEGESLARVVDTSQASHLDDLTSSTTSKPDKPNGNVSEASK